MRYYPINSKVLLIADIVKNDSRYDYIWEINIDKLTKKIITGYKIYFTFDSLGIKHIKLTVIDRSTKLSSEYNSDIYIVLPNSSQRTPPLFTFKNNGVWVTDSNVTIHQYRSHYYLTNVVKLSDSTALLIGSDYGSETPYNDCYIYNYLNHTLTPTGSIPDDRIRSSGSSSCLLKDGRVLLTGSYVSGSADIQFGNNHTWIYSPNSGTWTRVSDRHHPTETPAPNSTLLLPDGRVFSANCQSTYGIYDEIYDPVNDTWTVLPLRSLSGGSGGSYNAPSVCLLQDGRVFRGPGLLDGDTSCYVYDPIANTWEYLGSSINNKARIINLKTNFLLSVASNGNTSIYDVANNEWLYSDNPNISISGLFNLFLIPDGRVILYGLYSASITFINIFNPDDYSWSDFSSFNMSHTSADMLMLNDALVVFGSATLNNVIEYYPANLSISLWDSTISSGDPNLPGPGTVWGVSDANRYSLSLLQTSTLAVDDITNELIVYTPGKQNISINQTSVNLLNQDGSINAVNAINPSTFFEIVKSTDYPAYSQLSNYNFDKGIRLKIKGATINYPANPCLNGMHVYFDFNIVISLPSGDISIPFRYAKN